MQMWILFIAAVTLLLGCSRPTSTKDSSTITIKISREPGALAAMPSNRKACYGINVTGPGIEEKKGNSCSPSTGVVGGFVEAEKEISIQVLKGKSRKVEIFAFLQNSGENSPCPQLSAAMTPAQTTNTYSVGSTFVDILNDVAVVEITASFPGLVNHIAHQQSLPLTCGTVAGQPTPGRQISGGGKFELTGGNGSKLRGGVSRATPRIVATSVSGIQLIVD